MDGPHVRRQRRARGGDPRTAGPGADINARDDSGKTALMCAAMNGHKEAVQALLERSADATIQDKSGQTASALATGMGFEEIARQIDGHVRQP